MNRRAFCAGVAGALLAPRLTWAATGTRLTAKIGTAQIAPDGYPMTEVYGYEGMLPGPVIRAKQGARVTRDFVNELPVPTSIHWHGIRIDNAMDGVAGLTQDPVPTGGTFTYDFAVPDAGTYWYHAHTNSMEQVARGLYGPLIVEEANPPKVDAEEVLIFDDWLLDPNTAQIAGDFHDHMALSHGGRFGNLTGTNGRFDYRITARRGDRLRLRLINAANARIFVLRLEGLTGWTIALDGMPLETVEPVTGEIVLAPAQRVDLIVDVTATDMAAILMNADDRQWYEHVGFDLTGDPVADLRAAPEPLDQNPNSGLIDLSHARDFEMRMAGGAMGGMPDGQMNGQTMTFMELVQNGMYWTLAGVAGLGDAPFADLERGTVVRLKLINDTAFPHAMHLHGMHFREIRADGSQGPMRDTILSLPQQPIEVAFVADNPGKWLVHCHMLGHAAAGMNSWIRVA